MPRGWRWFGDRRRRALDGLDEEIRDHLDQEAATNIARGMPPEEARRQAHLSFGNVARVHEETRAVWSWGGVESVWQDLRVGARILTNATGLSVTAATLIALVVGINTTIFSVVNSLVTKPAPGVDRSDLVRIAAANRPGIPYFSYPDYLDYRTQTKTLQSLTAFTNGRVTLTTDHGSYAAWATAVEANYFDTIGVQPTLGRAFTAVEGRTVDASEVPAILSHRAWQEYFAANDDIIGRAISVNGRPAVVIGVAPPRFRGAMLTERADVWLPLLAFWRLTNPVAASRWATDRAQSPVDIIGRLAPEASVAAVQSDLSTIQRRLESAYPGIDRAPIEVVRYTATAGGVIPAAAPRFLALFSIVTLLTVVIVSANVANLMLARGAARQRETAIRLSIGASRGRIVRLLLAEGVAISVVAWFAACVIAIWVSRLLPQLLPQTPFAESGIDFTPSWRVLGYAMVLAAIGTIAFTLAPAIRAWRQDPLPWLKAGEHSVAHGRSRLADVLVVVQLTFSVVLLTTAGLATRSASMMTVDLGFDTNDLLLVTVRTTGASASRDANVALLDRIHERFAQTPGVRSVSYVRNAFWGSLRVHAGARQHSVSMQIVGDAYLATLGLSLTAGRPLTLEDRDRATAVAMINENLADALWPGQPAVGRIMTLGVSQPVEIVGVVRNAFVTGFNPERPNTRPNFVFITEQQSFASTGRGDPASPGDVTFYLRHDASALDTVGAAIAPALRQIDPRVAIVTLRTMNGQLDSLTLTARIIARLLAMFSIVSLVIAAIGQYAMIAFNMRRRVREFGVRIALGASGTQVVSSVLGEGIWLTSVGLICGLGLSLGVALAVRGVLFGVTPTDPRTYAGVFALLAFVAVVACCLPARAATRVDPVQALRQD
jgi:predicted permease